MDKALRNLALSIILLPEALMHTATIVSLLTLFVPLPLLEPSIDRLHVHDRNGVLSVTDNQVMVTHKDSTQRLWTGKGVRTADNKYMVEWWHGGHAVGRGLYEFKDNQQRFAGTYTPDGVKSYVILDVYKLIAP